MDAKFASLVARLDAVTTRLETLGPAAACSEGFLLYSYQLRSWSSGMMLACHAGDPGSIPGERKLLLIFWMPHRARRSPGYSELQNHVERCWQREMVPD